MEGHINIYGIICAEHDKEQLAKEYGRTALVSSLDVKNQIDSFPNAEKFTFHYRTEGGSVEEGFVIYDLKRELINEGKTVISKGEGVLKSIGTVAFLAADEREITENTRPYFHLPLVPNTGGNARDLEKTASELRQLEQRVAAIYSERMGITPEEAMKLMEADTDIEQWDALANGFITKITTPLKAVALHSQNQNNMDNKAQEEIKTGFQKMMAKLDEIFSSFGGKPQALKVSDANGVEIDFTDLADDATPSVGDKATVGGSPAEGEYIMPSGDTYVFAAGELTEIKPASDDSEEMETLKQENANKEAEIVALKASLAAAEAKNTETENKVVAIQAEMKTFKESIVSAGIDLDKKPEAKPAGDDSKKDPSNRAAGLKKFSLNQN